MTMPVWVGRAATTVLLVGLGVPSLASCADARPTAVSGSDQRPLPPHVFADSSFWYRRLPDKVALDPNSDRIIARAMRVAADSRYPELSRGRPDMAINTTVYTPPLYVAKNSDPVVTFKWDNCQGKRDDQGLIKNNLTNIHVPPDARPSEGSDGEMVIYNVDSKMYTDTWQTRYDGRTWHACWGGTISDAKKNRGVFPSHYGTTASGLPLEPGTLKASELASGRIDHVVGIVMPHSMMSSSIAPPATRTDGSSKDSDAIREGQFMRLPASLKIDSLKLSPGARMMAVAAQRYGFIVWDGGGSISFRAENAQAFKVDPYGSIFGGTHPALVMWGDPKKGQQPFPFEKLQVVKAGSL